MIEKKYTKQARKLYCTYFLRIILALIKAVVGLDR